MERKIVEGQTVLLLYKVAEMHESFASHGNFYIQGTVIDADDRSCVVLYCEPSNGAFVRKKVENENVQIL